MRTTVTLDEKLLERANELAGPMDRSTLLNTALRSLIARESARRLARLGGREPGLRAVPRRRMGRSGLVPKSAEPTTG